MVEVQRHGEDPDRRRGDGRGPPAEEEITEAVLASEAAIKDVIGHIAAGGSPTDHVVKAKMALIKPGLEKVTRGRREAQGPAGEPEDHRRHR